MGFLKASFYLEHLRGIDIKSIHIVTTPLDACSKEGSSDREQDCKWGPMCLRIFDALVDTLTTSLKLPREHVHVHDHESIMWSMHHIVFSDKPFVRRRRFFVCIVGIQSCQTHWEELSFFTQYNTRHIENNKVRWRWRLSH
jgi:hypothetical protein